MPSKKWSKKEINDLVKSRGLECQSIKYVKKQPVLELKCSQGHQWEVMPGLFKNGEWCPKCLSQAPPIPKPYESFFEGIELEGYSNSKVVRNYRRMPNGKLRKSLVELIEEFMIIQSKVMKIKADAYIYDLFKDNRCRALFPMIQAIVFMLFERNAEFPVSHDYLMRVREKYLVVKQIKKDIYGTDKYKQEGIRFELRPTH